MPGASCALQSPGMSSRAPGPPHCSLPVGARPDPCRAFWERAGARRGSRCLERCGCCTSDATQWSAFLLQIYIRVRFWDRPSRRQVGRRIRISPTMRISTASGASNSPERWRRSRRAHSRGLYHRAHQGAVRCGMRWYEAVRVGHSGHRWSQNRRPKRARTCLFWQDYCLLWQLKGNFAASHGCHRWSQRSQMVPDGHRWSQLVTESARAGCAR